MSINEGEADLYYSSLAQEADMAELVDQFVRELPGRLADVERAMASKDMAEVARLAHQLKGAGGSHGFPQITAAAAELERAAKSEDASTSVREALNRLAGVCMRTRAN